MPRPYILFASNSTGYRVGKIAQGVLQECHKVGISLLWREIGRSNPLSLATRPLGAIGWGPLADMELLVNSLESSIPVVSTIGHTLDRPIFTVVPDPGDIGRQVATHLLEEGLRHFVFVGPESNPAARLRAQAFETELARWLGRARVDRFHTDFEDRFWGVDTARGEAFVKLLRASPKPLGVFAFNDQIAVSCMECAEAAGIRIPQEMAIVGADDHPMFAQMYQPLSTVKIDYEQIGAKAFELVRLLQNRASRVGLPLRHFVGGELVVRASSRMRLLQDDHISRALHYIDAHFSEPIALTKLAQLSGLSRASFAQRFLRAVGDPPIRYLVDLRLKRAKLLLLESTLTISEIAYSVGFEDQGYFTRTFRRKWGVTPSFYREANGHFRAVSGGKPTTQLLPVRRP